MLLVAAAACGPARATTFITTEPGDLFTAADVVVLGTVSSLRRDAYASSVMVRVEETLKGPAATEVAVASPALSDGNENRRVIYGSPRFSVGERVLLFLVRNRRGALEPLFLSMGKFTILKSTDGADVAVRTLGDARTLALQRGSLQEVSPVSAYTLDSLRHLLEALAHGVAAPGSPIGIRAAPPPQVQQDFTFAGPPLTRWFLANDAAPLTYWTSTDGDAGLGLSASITAVEAALEAWADVACARLSLINAGRAAPAPYGTCDGQSQITFNDPFTEIPDPVNCTGVLAVGGVCGDKGGPVEFNGAVFHQIAEGDVVVNAGFAGCPFWTLDNLAELLTHEVGHTLGLAHSSNDPSEPDRSLRDATMYYAAHFDGRGARLESDDVAALCALYPGPRSPALFRRVAIVSDPTRPAPHDRLVIDAKIPVAEGNFDSRTDPVILDLRVAGASLFRLAVLPEQWVVSTSGTRFRYRGAAGTGSAVVRVSATTPSWLRVALRARGLVFGDVDPDALLLLSLAAGRAAASMPVSAAPSALVRSR